MWHTPLALSVCIDTILSQTRGQQNLHLSNKGTPGGDWIYALLSKHHMFKRILHAARIGIATRKLPHQVESSRGLIVPKNRLTL